MRKALFRLAAFALVSLPVFLSAQSRPAGAPDPAPTWRPTHMSWADYGSGPDNSKFVKFTQITKANVNQLQVAWTYFNGSTRFDPIVIDNVMYTMARNSSLVALDATTGKEMWIHTGLTGIAPRGVNYWESKDRSDRRLIFQINGNIEEINAQTGQSILTFGRNGLVDLREGLGRDPNQVARIQSSQPGRVFENLIILGSSTGENFLAPPGDLRAWDIVTGKLAWQFHTLPHPGEFGYETWPKDAWKYVGGVNTWGEITLDEARGIAYFPTGSGTYDMYGADRIGQDLFANCLIALDARTGKLKWYFQTVHHDLWDYDLTSAPQLLTLHRNGQTIDAVAQAGKTGFLFVFDRVTGQPIFPIEERPVPKSNVPGEQAWPTQPFSTLPTFARQTMTAADVNPYFFTPEEHADLVKRVQNARNEGFFTPPAYKQETVQIPGARGGSNVGTTAADPERGLFFVLTQDYPSLTNVEGTEIFSALGARGGGAAAAPADPGQATYQSTCQTCHGADRAGTANAPSLANVTSRLNYAEFRTVVTGGRAEMPAFSSLTDAQTTELYAFLSGEASARGGRGGRAGGAGAAGGGRGGRGGGSGPMTGPVVATGGAPGGLEPRLDENAMRAQYPGSNRFVGPPYPEGAEAPKERLYSGYNLITGLVAPPWSQIVAYDLNTGTIKWRKPLGEDDLAIAAGAKDAGMITGGESHAMVVTANGLVFANAKDGKVRAFDADTGNVVWTYKMPAGTTGMMSMYQAGGRQFLIVPSSPGPTFGLGRGGGAATDNANNQGYVVFALGK